MKAKEIFPVIENIAPLAIAEDWDNPGYQMGNLDREVKKIGVTHDWVQYFPGLVKKAIDEGCDLLLGHHPLSFRPLGFGGKFQRLGGSLVNPREDTVSKYMLEICQMVAESGVCVYSSHTPFDKAEGGTRDSFATTLGIDPILVGEPHKYRIGPIKQTTFSNFKKMAEKVLQTELMHSQGPEDKVIKTIAAIGGSGLASWDILNDLTSPRRNDIDCIIGSEATEQSKAYMHLHHPDIGYIQVHHSASERQGMHNMMNILKKLLPSDITLVYIWEPKPIYKL